MKYVFRTLSLPLILCLSIIAAIRDVTMLSWLWMKHGGEFFAYRKPSHTVLGVYQKLEKMELPTPTTT